MSPRLAASTLRKRLGSLSWKLRHLVHAMLRPAVLLRGSVYELKTRCGKPTCACREGEPHRRWVRSESREGKTRLRVVPEGELPAWKRQAEHYRQFRSRRAEYVRLTRQILQALDALERAQRREPEG